MKQYLYTLICLNVANNGNLILYNNLFLYPIKQATYLSAVYTAHDASSTKLTNCLCMNVWIQNYKALTKVCNIQIQPSFLETCPSSIDI